jgi:hypothetical protein
LDARRLLKRGTLRVVEEWEATWPIKAGQLYLCFFYFGSAIAKLRMSGLEWFNGVGIKELLLERSVRTGFEEGVARSSEWGYLIAKSDAITSILGASTLVFEFGFPLILLIRDTRIRLLFFIGVTGFHVANYVLINVQFLLLPILFLLFFDITVPINSFRRWQRGTPA